MASGDRRRPSDTTPGRRTPTFSAATVPPALLREHRTSVWAELQVEQGAVHLIEVDPPWEQTVEAPGSVVLVPGRAHRIEPTDDARFAVQFYDPAR